LKTLKTSYDYLNEQLSKQKAQEESNVTELTALSEAFQKLSNSKGEKVDISELEQKINKKLSFLKFD
jgi:hypothetical protein